MSLKTTYQYSFFVYPFLVTHGRYKDFISKFLKDEQTWDFKLLEDTDELDTHAYFLPYVKKFLFPTLYWSKEYKDRYKSLKIEKKIDIISSLTCTKFDYKLKSDSKNYKLNKKGISFNINNIELICFDAGICFLILKTKLNGDIINSGDILDFNYKFRTINPRYQRKKKTEGIFVLNDEFSEVEDLSSFIDNLLYGYEDLEAENIYFDRLFTYAYMCLDKSEWNEERELNEIINEFYKFQYVLPNSFDSTFDQDFKGMKDNTYSRWKYSIYGFSRESGVVFASDKENFNIEKLPLYYESMYFYVFLLAFYQRIALILFSQELMNSGRNKIDDLKERFTKFTHFSWFSQITNSEQGMDIWKKWQKAFDLPELFDEVQKEYSEFYDYTVAKGQEKINSLLIVIYIISLIFSGMILLADFKIVDGNNNYAKIFLVGMIIITAGLYPLLLLFKLISKEIFKIIKNI
ncbi:MAG TPA: hypothetical protein VIK72_13585 [Clostridiaceae bacterium]